MYNCHYPVNPPDDADTARALAEVMRMSRRNAIILRSLQFLSRQGRLRPVVEIVLKDDLRDSVRGEFQYGVLAVMAGREYVRLMKEAPARIFGLN